MRNTLSNGNRLEIKATAVIHNAHPERWLVGVIVGVSADEIKVKLGNSRMCTVRRGSDDYRELLH